MCLGMSWHIYYEGDKLVFSLIRPFSLFRINGRLFILISRTTSYCYDGGMNYALNWT